VTLTVVDWVAIVVVLLSALAGFQRGLVLSAFSLAGIAVGAYAGSRLAPHLLHGGSTSPWTAVAGLIGAIVGAVLLQVLALFAASAVRGGLRLAPLRVLDSVGGLLFGAATGLAIVWVGAAVAMLAPGQTRLRADVARSQIVQRLDAALPPRTLLHLLSRIDPFPSIAGPAAPSQPPSPSVLHDSTIRTAASSVVKVLGTACGVGVEGSGWFAAPDLVVTAAHVVAGEHDTIVRIPGESLPRPVDVVSFDSHNDIAILRVPGAGEKALPFVDPQPGAAVAIVGFPLDGGLTARPGRIGRTAIVLTQDALGHGPVARNITAVAGRVEHGNSGGPAIDANGAVQATIFAARVGSTSGYGVPAEVVRHDLASAGTTAVSTGACAP
jgi:uncharacterized membrane protein required for colicin V production